MITIVLTLSARSVIISVSLLKFWRTSRSYLMMFDDGGLILRKILATYGCYLLVLIGYLRVLSAGSLDKWLTLFNNFLLWNLIGRHCKVGVFGKRRDRNKDVR